MVTELRACRDTSKRAWNPVALDQIGDLMTEHITIPTRPDSLTLGLKLRDQESSRSPWASELVTRGSVKRTVLSHIR